MCACAVKDFELRGCIGTLSPRPIVEVFDFTRKSAFQDRRFEPLDASELPHLRIGVSLLVAYEDCAHPEDWIVGVHGIILDFSVHGQTYSGTYLPEVAAEQGWKQPEALQSLVRKAGYRGAITPEIRATMKVTRYQSSKAMLTFDEWQRMEGLARRA